MSAHATQQVSAPGAGSVTSSKFPQSLALLATHGAFDRTALLERLSMVADDVYFLPEMLAITTTVESIESYQSALAKQFATLPSELTIVDSHWRMVNLPAAVHLLKPARVLIVVADGVASVDSWYQMATRSTEYAELLTASALAAGFPADEWNGLSLFEQCCASFTLGGILFDATLAHAAQNSVFVMRCERLMSDDQVRDDAIRLITGKPLPSRPAATAAGYSEVIWRRWDAKQRAAFMRFCAVTQQRFGYTVPDEQAVPLPSYIQLPGDAAKKIRVVPIEQLPHEFGFSEAFPASASSRGTPFNKWTMDANDAPILRYIIRNFRPRRHLEFGTWQGMGTKLVLEESAASVWTINLFSGEERNNGDSAYSHTAAEFAELDAWANRMKLAKFDRNSYRTDTIGFIGRHYLAAGLGHRVNQIYSDSVSWADGAYPDGFFDTVLVDGGHQAEILINDTRKSVRLVRSGGLVMWHDVNPEMYGVWGATTGVMDGLAAIYDELCEQFSQLFWIEPSFVLVGVKR